MIKRPEPGTVKTRLVPPLTHEEAAALYARFTEDVLSSALAVRGVHVYAAHAGYGSTPELPPGIRPIEQVGADLGERMHGVVSRLFDKGYSRVAVIGSDSPDLPPELMDEAFRILDEKDLVIGPATDGGYYLIGMRRPSGAVFKDVPWSTPLVLEATLERAAAEGLSTGLLEPWHDIDTPDDLEKLSERAAPRTRAFLKSLEKPL